jgi:hypothetical protein
MWWLIWLVALGVALVDALSAWTPLPRPGALGATVAMGVSKAPGDKAAWTGMLALPYQLASESPESTRLKPR